MSPPFLLKGPDSNESGPFFCYFLFNQFPRYFSAMGITGYTINAATIITVQNRAISGRMTCIGNMVFNKRSEPIING